MLSEIKNFYYLTELIATSGQPTESQLAEIRAAGYEVVINLALHDNPEYSLPDERGTVEKLGMHYIHIPVLFDHPTTQNLEDFFQAMRENENRKVLVHCAMNYRVSAFMGLYLRIVKKMTHAESFTLMCKVWEPDEVWAPFIAEALKAHGIES
jgi:protein tyrosine phosphatase (PTP) superfamily phosphohydrolase (DUF442 family)